MTDFPFVVVEGIGRWAGIGANVLLVFDRVSVHMMSAKGIGIVLRFLFRIFVFALLNIVD